MKISVIIPCYNQSSFLNDTCNSIIKQTYKNWECLIIDDGSTDNCKKVSQKICDKDDRFKYIYKENGGLSSARNLGLDNAKGDYIQFLDSDDLVEPLKFEKSLKTEKDLIISNFKMLENNTITDPFCNLEGQVFSFESLLLNWDNKFSIPIHCGLFKTSIISDIRFNKDLKAKEDWLFWLEFFNKNPSVKFIHEHLAVYRMHGNNMTKDHSHMLDNTHKVNQLIYKQFDHEIKNIVFKKTNDLLIHEQYKYNFIHKKYEKEKKKRKKLIQYIIISTIIILLIFIIFIKF